MNKPQIETMAVSSDVAAAEGDGRTLKGYASVFDYPIETGDPFTTFIRPGAFTKTLKENGDEVKMLFNHGADPTIGEKPLGRLSVLTEDKKGLYFEGEFAETSYGRDLMELIRAGALDGMSIQFEAKQEDWNDDRTERYIQQVRLYELGPVTFPANLAARAELHRRATEFHLDDSPWDGNRAMSECDTAACYRQISAGERNVGEPEERQHWALPHHYPGMEANAAGVRNARARLEQTEGLINKDTARDHLFNVHKLPSDEAEASPPGDRATTEAGASPNGDRLTWAEERLMAAKADDASYGREQEELQRRVQRWVRPTS